MICTHESTAGQPGAKKLLKQALEAAYPRIAGPTTDITSPTTGTTSPSSCSCKSQRDCAIRRPSEYGCCRIFFIFSLRGFQSFGWSSECDETANPGGMRSELKPPLSLLKLRGVARRGAAIRQKPVPNEPCSRAAVQLGTCTDTRPRVAEATNDGRSAHSRQVSAIRVQRASEPRPDVRHPLLFPNAATSDDAWTHSSSRRYTR